MRLDVAGSRKRLKEFGRLLGITVDPDARAGRPRPRPPAAGRDHQGAVARIAGADPGRADLDADPAGVARAAAACWSELKGQGLAIVVHHPQAARGASRSETASRCSAEGASSAAIDHERVRASSPEVAARPRSSRLMFGDEATAAPEMVELALDSESVAADRPAAAFQATTPMLELVDATARGDGDEPGIDRTSRSHCGEARCSASPAIDGNGQRALAEVISRTAPPDLGLGRAVRRRRSADSAWPHARSSACDT